MLSGRRTATNCDHAGRHSRRDCDHLRPSLALPTAMNHQRHGGHGLSGSRGAEKGRPACPACLISGVARGSRASRDRLRIPFWTYPAMCAGGIWNDCTRCVAGSVAPSHQQAPPTSTGTATTSSWLGLPRRPRDLALLGIAGLVRWHKRCTMHGAPVVLASLGVSKGLGGFGEFSPRTHRNSSARPRCDSDPGCAWHRISGLASAKIPGGTTQARA
jgi:hypothetical protein